MGREMYYCPNCGAVAVEGNDDDFQVFCVGCRKSFRTNLETVRILSQSEVDEVLSSGEYREIDSQGWTTFVKKQYLRRGE